MALVKLNNRGVRSATTFGSITGLGSMIFIKKVTASSSATVSFVDGTSDVVLDDTYKEYLFTFNNIHPSAAQYFQFNGSDDDSSHSYDVTKTTTVFSAVHKEDDGEAAISYKTAADLAQSTSAAPLSIQVGTENDGSLSGYLHLFNPSSTTYVKNFIANVQHIHGADYCTNSYMAGYFNDTDDITAIQFSMSSGNIDAGDICLYGIA